MKSSCLNIDTPSTSMKIGHDVNTKSSTNLCQGLHVSEKVLEHWWRFTGLIFDGYWLAAFHFLSSTYFVGYLEPQAHPSASLSKGRTKTSQVLSESPLLSTEDKSSTKPQQAMVPIGTIIFQEYSYQLPVGVALGLVISMNQKALLKRGTFYQSLHNVKGKCWWI